MQDRVLPRSTKAAFGVGQLAEGLKNTSFGALVLFYFNQVLEVPGTLCGIALGVALLFDAVTDPLAGSLSDNWRGRGGRRHPFMYASALPLALCFYLLFAPPQLGTRGLFVWLLGFAVLTRGAMTLYHVPHLALGAELTENFEERTSIVAWRQAFGYLGAMLVMVIGFGVYFADARGGRTNAAAYPAYALPVALLMAATILLSAWGTRREIPFLPRPTDDGGSPRALSRLARELRSAFTNLSFRWLFAGVLIVFLMVGVDAALGLYMNQYFWELSGREMMVVGLVYPLGLVAGSPFVRALHEKFDKRPGLVLGTAGWAVLQILPVLLRLAGAFPENDSAGLVPLLCGIRFLQGAIVQQALVSFGSMMADVADEHELESGRRQEGIFFGAVAFSGKAASGLGTLLAGAGLDLISWPTGSEVRSAADVDPGTVVWLGLLWGPIVSGFAAVSVWCYLHYALDRARHAEILVLLRARRAGRVVAGGATPRAPGEVAGGIANARGSATVPRP